MAFVPDPADLSADIDADVPMRDAADVAADLAAEAATSRGPLVDALCDVRRAFAPRRARDGVTRLLPAFWLDMLQAQIDEARGHLAAGMASKALAEIADCFSVGWQALADNTPDAEAFIVNRIRTRIIPRVEELADRDLAKVAAQLKAA